MRKLTRQIAAMKQTVAKLKKAAKIADDNDGDGSDGSDDEAELAEAPATANRNNPALTRQAGNLRGRGNRG